VAAIHWGTLKITDEFYLEPRSRLIENAKTAGLKQGEFFAAEHGQTNVLAQ
jgi:hypothetical protein